MNKPIIKTLAKTWLFFCFVYVQEITACSATIMKTFGEIAITVGGRRKKWAAMKLLSLFASCRKQKSSWW